ncbi:hypothetical protein CBG25_05235 [Arsenophonus sp. ENCA]|nr:hypothetical protein CBG25_05235 [Arsenophonus sp. ENCA]
MPSIDIGLMQINSQHINYLKSLGITPYQLRNDACMNIYTGAYFLALAFNKWGVTWQAIGAYNAGFKNNEIQTRVSHKTNLGTLIKHGCAQQ